MGILWQPQSTPSLRHTKNVLPRDLSTVQLIVSEVQSRLGAHNGDASSSALEAARALPEPQDHCQAFKNKRACIAELSGQGFALVPYTGTTATEKELDSSRCSTPFHSQALRSYLQLALLVRAISQDAATAFLQMMKKKKKKTWCTSKPKSKLLQRLSSAMLRTWMPPWQGQEEEEGASTRRGVIEWEGKRRAALDPARYRITIHRGHSHFDSPKPSQPAFSSLTLFHLY